MEFGISRRRVLKSAGAGGLACLAGCGSPGPEGEENTFVRGRVTDLSGNPIEDARVEVVRMPDHTGEERRSDGNGKFELPVERSAWLRTSHSEYLTRVRAIASRGRSSHPPHARH
ncbi:carboxypeptidase-like regulatory domain-containing protein [Halobacterium jilantaiense]|uniref:carboxypeptidase-like regulatory domain-containing protein n=1 Tax=Halobacterium jilantaiense TaxID=355548 RepID=UPI000B7DF87A